MTHHVADIVMSYDLEDGAVAASDVAKTSVELLAVIDDYLNEDEV